MRFRLCLLLVLNLGWHTGSVWAVEFVSLNLGDGLKNFNNYCVNCHAHDGRGSVHARTVFNNMPILLANREATPRQYFKRIMYGGPHMAPMDWELSALEVWEIVYALPLLRQQRPLQWQHYFFHKWVKQ